jgi:hypothetical protein
LPQARRLCCKKPTSCKTSTSGRRRLNWSTFNDFGMMGGG